MKNKKGVSAVIATVLIILITIAAVTIIWAAIIPLIQNLIGVGTTCLEVMNEVELGDRTCKINESAVLVQVVRGSADFEWADIQISVESVEGVSESYYLDEEGIFNYTNFPGRNEARTITITNITGLGSNIDKIGIAPIVSVGGKSENCGIISTKKVNFC
jgi:flagellin-like protein